MLFEPIKVAPDPVLLESAAIERLQAAWSEFSGHGMLEEVRTLRAPRDEGKSVVFGLGRVGPGGVGVVAKELLSEAAQTELTVYRDVLPRLSNRGPDVIGSIDSIADGRMWLFLEEIRGPGFDKKDPEQVGIASRWLAEFHSGTSQSGLDGLLARREPEYYTSLGRRALADLDEVAANPMLDKSQIGVLRQLSGHLSRFVGSSAAFGDVYVSMPSALVHGDFKGNNMAFTKRTVHQDLRVFDWSEAHRGPLAIDTWRVDHQAYQTALRDAGIKDWLEGFDAWTLFGSVTRWVMAVSWELPRLRYQWVDRPMRRMSLYETRLRSTLEESHWL